MKGKDLPKKYLALDTTRRKKNKKNRGDLHIG
jgi:hypothetical protein